MLSPIVTMAGGKKDCLQGEEKGIPTKGLTSIGSGHIGLQIISYGIKGIKIVLVSLMITESNGGDAIRYLDTGLRFDRGPS